MIEDFEIETRKSKLKLGGRRRRNSLAVIVWAALAVIGWTVLMLVLANRSMKLMGY